MIFPGLVHGYGYFLDPDGYWVEILNDNLTEAPGEEDPEEIKKAFHYA